MAGIAVEIAIALDGAIVLARGILEDDADPVAGGEGGLADELDGACAAVVELDDLADLECVCHRAGFRGIIRQSS